MTPPGSLHLAALSVGCIFAFRALALLPGAGPDVFGAKQAAAVASLGLSAVWLGLSFGSTVWSIARRSLPGATLAIALLLLVDRQLGGSGILGNTGYDMQILLPGAAVGLRIWYTDPRRLTGLLAFLCTLLFATLAPILGGLVVLLIIASLALFAKLQKPKASRRVLAAVFALTLLLCAGRLLPLPSFSFGSTEPPTAGVHAANPNLGGIGVRIAVWKSLIALGPTSHKGLGTGQFQALYPPLRDPLEIAATTSNHTIETVTEVGHPHNDLLLVFAESGTLPALVLGLALLVLGIWAVRRQLCPTTNDPSLAAGVLALILAGSFHVPLFSNPFGAVFGGLLIGALASESDATQHKQRTWTRVLRLGFGLAIAISLFGTLAWKPVRFDAAARSPELSSLDAASEATEAGLLPFELAAARARAEPTPSEAARWWDLALKLRPYSIEALMSRGMAAGRQGDLFTAQHLWHTALELDPAHPLVTKNLRRLGADLVLAGRLEPGLKELAPNAGPDPSVIEALAANQSAPFSTAFQSAAAWLNGRKLFEQGQSSLARFELERAAQIADHAKAARGTLGLEIAVLISLEGHVQEARARIAALAKKTLAGSSISDLISELPTRLQVPAKLLAPRR